MPILVILGLYVVGMVARDHTTHHLSSSTLEVALRLVIEHGLMLLNYLFLLPCRKFLCGIGCAPFVRQVVTLHLIEPISNLKDVFTTTLKCITMHSCVHI